MDGTTIELKSVKVNEQLSEETTCFSATVYVDGVQAFIASNRGHGAQNDYQVLERGSFDKALAFAHSIYAEAWPFFVGSEEMLDFLVDSELQKWQTNAWLKKQCRTKVLFHMPAEIGDDSKWAVYSGKYTPEFAQELRKEYGQGIEIANERFLPK